MSDEEISCDENFANELVKAGLKIKRKRVSKSKVQKTKKKPGIDQTQHAELANIEHLPFIEKIGNKYFHLNSETQPQSEKNTLHNSSVLFGANQQIDITVLSCVPLQTTSLTSAVKPCNILSKSIREDPPVLQDSLPYLIDAPVAIQPSLLLDELSPCFIESPAAVQFNSTGEDCSEFPIQRECLPSLLDAPAVTQSNTESSNSPNLLVVPAVNGPCTSFNLESSNSPEVPAANQPCLSFNQEPSNSPEVPDANQSCSSLDPEPSNSPSLLEVPSANQSCSPLASNSPEVPAANQPCSSFNQEPSNSPEVPAAYQSCSSFDPELSNSNSPSLLEVPSANQSCSPSAIPLLDNDNENSNNRVSIISDIPYHGDLTQNKKRKSKATKDPKLWQRNITKEKREKGESYLGYRRDKNVGSTKFKVKHDVFKPARSMKPTCTSSFCVKSKLRACNSILDTSREQLFKTFWKNMSWEQRRAYICCHVSKCEKKITKNPTSIRNESRAYFLTIENVRYQVCKKMFLATLGIKDWFVRYWLDKTDCAMPPDVKKSQIKKISLCA